jgi:hypothetical protein
MVHFVAGLLLVGVALYDLAKNWDVLKLFLRL